MNVKINPKITTIIVALALILFFFLAYVAYFIPVGKATLSWNPNTEPNLSGYRVYYGLTPRTDDCPMGGYSKSVNIDKTDGGIKPTVALKGLYIWKNYYFSVTSVGKNGKESCFSSEVDKRIRSIAF